MPTVTASQTGRGTQPSRRGQRKRARGSFSELLNLHSSIIQRSTQIYPQFRIENFPVDDISIKTMRRIFDEILVYAPFSMIAQAGLVLKHKFSDELRYFYPGYQSMLFERALRVFSGHYVDNVLKKYNPSQIIENFSHCYPDSNWIFVCITNIRVFLTIAEFL